ncbi:hypothetical protein [Microbispora corallina]|uniref:hypothetical protein n=1 Tax=Microbispora corallina TaxID=83302 RepID=UPI001EF3717A|nr:hypothetical protein [Microbispora corallina]
MTRHVGGIQNIAASAAWAGANHLVLTVSGLPSSEAPDGRWLVDLGMGTARVPTASAVGQGLPGPPLSAARELIGWSCG